MKCSVFVATSLDGFIARDDGAIDWLPSPQGPGGEDYGFAAFMADVDVLVMGRKTFATALTFGVWPYTKPVVVLTTRPNDLPVRLPTAVTTTQGAPGDVMAHLESRGFRHACVDGGTTVQRFLEAGAISRLIITQVPVLLGRGIPLFGPLPHDVALRHLRTRAFPNGLVQSEYLTT